MNQNTNIRGPAGIRKVPTGIQGFDEITGGGLPHRRTTLVVGGAGTVTVETAGRTTTRSTPIERVVTRRILPARGGLLQVEQADRELAVKLGKGKVTLLPLRGDRGQQRLGANSSLERASYRFGTFRHGVTARAGPA